jgi:DNA-binding SARP family transcriptional activator
LGIGGIGMSRAEHHELLTEARSAALCLLGGPFVIKNGRRVEIPEGSKRLLVFVALNGGRVRRQHAAGTLWPFGDDERASGNLRTALWRLRRAGIDVLHADKRMLYLDPEVPVDITQLSRSAKRVIDGSAEGSEFRALDVNREALDLLPGWYDEWVIFERERLRQRLLHAMEILAGRLISSGLFADAVDVAVAAVCVEPLRESAQRVLIEAHLAEGNFVEAHRAYIAYDKMLEAELGVSPSAKLAEMVGREADTNRSRHDRSISFERRAPSLTSSRLTLATADSRSTARAVKPARS